MASTTPHLTGGCQCGAIRFAASAPIGRISICHCRMCQKATGAPFAALAGIDYTNFEWTRGTPATFKSSSVAERDFCRDCGTPLSYRAIGWPKIEIMTGTFDQPERVVPTLQLGTESQLGWVAAIANMPSRSTLENVGADRLNTIVSHQHPDHE